MNTAPRSGKQLLVVANDVDRGAQVARMLSALGYDTAVCEPATVLWHCRQRAPHAVVIAAGDDKSGAVQSGLREVKWLQRRGELPRFPIVAAGHPDTQAAVELIDGIVLEPGRLTSLAVEISKQVDAASPSALSSAPREDA